jgi:hypothetical protein
MKCSSGASTYFGGGGLFSIVDSVPPLSHPVAASLPAPVYLVKMLH